MRYIAYKNLAVSAGISHQKSNLFAMMKEAWITNRILLLPKFRLAAHHNCGRSVTTQLTEYFDMGSGRVNGEAIVIQSALSERISDSVCIGRRESALQKQERIVTRDVRGEGLVRYSLEKLYKGFGDREVSIGIHPELVATAKQASELAAANAVWVHVRRGDLLHKTAKATSAENIEHVVRRCAPEAKVVYIATNERSREHFLPLARSFKLVMAGDIPDFVELGRQDNYKLFLVEQAFGRLFSTRVSTFTTGCGNYHGALSGAKGWQ